MYSSPLSIAITYLCGRIQQRIRSDPDGGPESGALSLEWVVIAVILVGAAATLAVFLTKELGVWENQIPQAPGG